MHESSCQSKKQVMVIWNWSSGELCGLWASCLTFQQYFYEFHSLSLRGKEKGVTINSKHGLHECNSASMANCQIQTTVPTEHILCIRIFLCDSGLNAPLSSRPYFLLHHNPDPRCSLDLAMFPDFISRSAWSVSPVMLYVDAKDKNSSVAEWISEADFSVNLTQKANCSMLLTSADSSAITVKY